MAASKHSGYGRLHQHGAWLQTDHWGKEKYNLMIENLRSAEYASLDEYNHLKQFSINGSASNLLYDFDIPACQEAYYKSIQTLKNIGDFEEHIFGNFNFNESNPKQNLVRSYTIGNVLGDLDDLGGSFGRFSLRTYIKGTVKDQNFQSPDYCKFFLNISEIGFRYIDEFSFKGEQSLGVWKHDIINSELPKRYSNPDGWIKLTNADYQKLANRKLGIGKEFIIHTELGYLTNNALQTPKDIIFFFSL